MSKPEDGNGAVPEQLAAPQFRIASVALNENECRNIVALMTTGVKTLNDPRELAGCSQFVLAMQMKFDQALAPKPEAAPKPPATAPQPRGKRARAMDTEPAPQSQRD
jgi:hypothetical protein